MAEPLGGVLTPITLPDGIELHAKTWKPEGALKARLIYLHGFSDHIGRTADLFPALARTGIEVLGIDQRGWGHSVKKPSDRGHTGGTTQIMSDITNFIKQKLPSEVPLFLGGHSMGGGEVLYYAANGPREVLGELAGIIAVAPWIALDPKVEPWRITVALGRLVAGFFPKFTIKNKLDASLISRDPASNKLWEDDPLCHDMATLQTFEGALTRAQDLSTGKAAPLPEVKSIWLGHGDADRITDWQASERYNRRAKHKEMVFKLYPGAYHALHVEPGTKDEFFQDLSDFILARSKSVDPHSKL